MMLAVLLCVASGAVVRRTVQVEAEGAKAQVEDDQCGAPGYDFAAQRSSLVQECSRRDVCLLMRELDADFQARAVESDFSGPVGRRYLSSGSCSTGMKKLGVNLEGLSEYDCKEEADTKGRKYEVIFDPDRPSGCFSMEKGRKKDMKFNKAQSDKSAGIEYVSISKYQSVKYTFKLICDEVKRLSDYEARFFSPYKLTQETKGRTRMNTACSPGKMAQLFRDGKTASPCAEILAFKPSSQYRQAEDAVAAGDLEHAQKWMADNTLFDVITNDWCPGIWDEVQTQGATCEIPAPTRNYTPKIAMTELACSEVLDEPFSARLEGLDASKPPDFYKDAWIGEGGR